MMMKTTKDDADTLISNSKNTKTKRSLNKNLPQLCAPNKNLTYSPLSTVHTMILNSVLQL